MLSINHSLKAKKPINFDGLYRKHGLLHAIQWRKAVLQYTIITYQAQSGNVFKSEGRKKNPNCLWHTLWSYDKELVRFFCLGDYTETKIIDNDRISEKDVLNWWSYAVYQFVDNNIMFTEVLCFLVFIGLLLFYLLNSNFANCICIKVSHIQGINDRTDW